VAHGAGVVAKPEPFDRAVHQVPPCRYRAVMSSLPSPLKSPACTSTQVAPVLHVAQREVLKAVLPLDRPVYHWPFCKARAVMSALPSPLKSPTFTSTQVAPVLQLAQSEVLKTEPLDRPV